jgi:hypothetical protein
MPNIRLTWNVLKQPLSTAFDVYRPVNGNFRAEQHLQTRGWRSMMKVQGGDHATVERGTGSLSAIRNHSMRWSLTDLTVGLGLHQSHSSRFPRG